MAKCTSSKITKNKQEITSPVLTATASFDLICPFNPQALLYFFSHHLTDDPRAHHEEVEILRAPNGLRFLNSV